MANDLWRTPQWLFNWLNGLYGPFDIDLAASKDNTKLERFYSITDNALIQDWHHNATNGFCNPPYSKLPPWLEKATLEQQFGFHSTWVLPAWNGEKFWLPYCFNAATHISLIFGRVSFLDYYGEQVTGNRAGTMIAHYNGYIKPPNSPKILYFDRDDLIKAFS